MKDQINTIREALNTCMGLDKALTALDQIEAMAGEPVATVTSETGNPDISMSWWHEPALPVGTKLYAAPVAQQPQCRDLSDADMDKIATWIGDQECGHIGFQGLCDRIIRAFSTPVAQQPVTYLKETVTTAGRKWAPVAQRPQGAYHPDESAVREACEILTRIRDAYDHWGGWSGTKQQADEAINLLRYGSGAQSAQQPQAEPRCELGCTTECKAKQHGCASECPALPWQQQAEAVPELTDSQIMASVGRHAGGPYTSISGSRPLGQQWTQICALVRHIIRERYCGVAPQQAEAVPSDVVRDAEAVRKALDRAFIMGQNYCADADSESYSANKRSDVTRQKFNAMRDEVCAAIAAQGASHE